MPNKISVIIDVAVDKANQSLGSFRKSIQDADGAAGKFKAGAGAALDSVKANAGALAMAGGAALVAFGANAVSAFQDTALAAGKLRDSLGVTAEEASRLMEVAEDLGIGTETLEKSIGIMNRTAANTPGHFADIGAELVKNADGTTNVNETFLSTIDALNRIPDASQRAAAAQKVFGRGWMEMSELIGMGADGVREALDSVEGGKIIDDSEVADAREFRDTLDLMKGSAEQLAVAFGGPLVRGLTTAMDALLGFQNAVKGIDESLGPVDNALVKVIGTSWKYLNPVGQAITLGKELAGTNEDVAETTDETTDAIEDNTGAIEGNANALRDRITALEKSEAAERGAQSASLSYRQQVADTAEAVRIATLQQLDATLTDEQRAQAARDAEAAVLAQADAAVKLAEDQAAANGETLSAQVKTQIYIDELRLLAATLGGPARAEIEAHIARLMGIPTSLYTNVGVIRGGDLSPVVGGKRASGGPVAPGGTYLVGEEGPELLQMGNTSGNVVNAPQTAAALNGSGGGTTNVYVTVNGADPNTVIAAIRKYVRTNGPLRGVT